MLAPNSLILRHKFKDSYQIRTEDESDEDTGNGGETSGGGKPESERDNPGEKAEHGIHFGEEGLSLCHHHHH